MLLEKYSRDVAFVLGIPPSFVVSKSNMTGSTSSSQQGENTHTFSTNAQSICRHLERLLSDVHQVIYGGDAVDFSIVPMPRLTIESMEVNVIYHHHRVVLPSYLCDGTIDTVQPPFIIQPPSNHHHTYAGYQESDGDGAHTAGEVCAARRYSPGCSKPAYEW